MLTDYDLETIVRIYFYYREHGPRVKEYEALAALASKVGVARTAPQSPPQEPS